MIENDSLRSDIVHLYDRTYPRIANSIVNYIQNLRDFRRPLLHKYFRIPEEPQGRWEPYDFDQMINDKQLKNEVVLMLGNARFTIHFQSTECICNSVL